MEIKHYGVKGMKWDEHKIISPKIKPKLNMVSSKSDGVIMPTRSDLTKERQRQIASNIKSIPKQVVQSGKKIISSMSNFMSKPIVKVGNIQNIKLRKFNKGGE